MARAGSALERMPAKQTMLQSEAGPIRSLLIPWREARSVQPEKLRHYIRMLERFCAERPQNADARTCLGLAHAMNDDLSRSMEVLEEARSLDPGNFFAQLKFAELHSRQGAWERADDETCRAAELAKDSGELSLARTQLAEIRRLRWEGAPKSALTNPVIGALMLMAILGAILLAWK